MKRSIRPIDSGHLGSTREVSSSHSPKGAFSPLHPSLVATSGNDHTSSKRHSRGISCGEFYVLMHVVALWYFTF